MRLADVFSSKAVGMAITEAGSNKQPYLGLGLFPAKKKAGLDLKWIKASKGVGVSLMPSNFDAVSTIRTREGFKIDETEMAFFRESMLLKESDRQEILRVADANDPYAQTVINSVYDDASALVEGAEVVAERMRMSLLNPTNGHPSISISANGVTYAYNYDADGSYATNNYVALSGNSLWTAPTTADPLADLQSAIEKIEGNSGTKIEYAIMSRDTINKLKACDSVKSAILAQNVTANVLITDTKVKELIKTELGVQVIVYTKSYKTEAGVVTKFFQDGFVALIPSGALGSTWFGTTPEEADLVSGSNIDTTIVNTGVSVTVVTLNDPVNVKTTVSEIVLPSFERMDETFVIKAY